MKIIMVSGLQGSGKTTLCKGLCDKLEHPVFLNFADPLYELHNAVLEKARGMGIKVPRDPDGPLLQLLGTDWGRNTIDVDLWCDYLRDRIATQKGLWADELTFVIGDLRMVNEFHFMDAHLAPNDSLIRVRLECPEEVRKERRGPKWRPNTKHQSEIDLDDYVKTGRFDIVLHTHLMDVETCVSSVLSLLENT